MWGWVTHVLNITCSLNGPFAQVHVARHSWAVTPWDLWGSGILPWFPSLLCLEISPSQLKPEGNSEVGHLGEEVVTLKCTYQESPQSGARGLWPGKNRLAGWEEEALPGTLSLVASKLLLYRRKNDWFGAFSIYSCKCYQRAHLFFKNTWRVMGISEDRNWPSNVSSTGELPAHPLSLCNPMKPLQMQWEKVLWSCRNHRETTARATFSILSNF